jgi:hypothetical protein
LIRPTCVASPASLLSSHRNMTVLLTLRCLCRSTRLAARLAEGLHVRGGSAPRGCGGRHQRHSHPSPRRNLVGFPTRSVLGRSNVRTSCVPGRRAFAISWRQALRFTASTRRPFFRGLCPRANTGNFCAFPGNCLPGMHPYSAQETLRPRTHGGHRSAGAAADRAVEVQSGSSRPVEKKNALVVRTAQTTAVDPVDG